MSKKRASGVPGWDGVWRAAQLQAQPFRCLEEPVRLRDSRGSRRFFWGSPPLLCLSRPWSVASFRSPVLPFMLFDLAMNVTLYLFKDFRI